MKRRAQPTSAQTETRQRRRISRTEKKEAEVVVSIGGGGFTALGLARFEQNDFLDLASHRALRETCTAFGNPESMCQRDKAALLLHKVLRPNDNSPAISHVLEWVKTCTVNVLQLLRWHMWRLEMDVASADVHAVLDKLVLLLESTFGSPRHLPKAWEVTGGSSFSAYVSKHVLASVSLSAPVGCRTNKWDGVLPVGISHISHSYADSNSPTPCFNHGTLEKVAWALRRSDDLEDIRAMDTNLWPMLFGVYSCPRAPTCLLLDSMPEEARTWFFRANFGSMTSTMICSFLQGLCCTQTRARNSRPFGEQDAQLASAVLLPLVTSFLDFTETMRTIYSSCSQQGDFVVFIGLVLAFMKERGTEVVLHDLRDFRIKTSVYTCIFKTLSMLPEFKTPEQWNMLWQRAMALPFFNFDEMDVMFRVFPPNIWANDAGLIFHVLSLPGAQLRLVNVLLGSQNQVLNKRRGLVSGRDLTIVDEVASIARKKAEEQGHWMHFSRYARHFFGIETPQSRTKNLRKK